MEKAFLKNGGVGSVIVGAYLDYKGLPQERRKYLSAENDGITQEWRKHLYTMKKYLMNGGSLSRE